METKPSQGQHFNKVFIGRNSKFGSLSKRWKTKIFYQQEESDTGLGMIRIQDMAIGEDDMVRSYRKEHSYLQP